MRFRRAVLEATEHEQLTQRALAFNEYRTGQIEDGDHNLAYTPNLVLHAIPEGAFTKGYELGARERLPAFTKSRGRVKQHPSGYITVPEDAEAGSLTTYTLESYAGAVETVTSNIVRETDGEKKIELNYVLSGLVALTNELQEKYNQRDNTENIAIVVSLLNCAGAGLLMSGADQKHLSVHSPGDYSVQDDFIEVRPTEVPAEDKDWKDTVEDLEPVFDGIAAAFGFARGSPYSASSVGRLAENYRDLR